MEIGLTGGRRGRRVTMSAATTGACAVPTLTLPIYSTQKVLFVGPVAIVLDHRGEFLLC
jgi:hypothetical protein